MSVDTPPVSDVSEHPVSIARRRRLGRFVLPTYSWLVIAYLVFPIAIMIFYSFNRVVGGLQLVSFNWNGFTDQWYRQWSDVPGLTSAFWLSIRLAVISTVIATARHIVGNSTRPLSDEKVSWSCRYRTSALP